jgi:hypothetical protein
MKRPRYFKRLAKRKGEKENMPKRFIEIPQPVVLKDPLTKEILRDKDGKPEEVVFETFLNKLMHNPKWVESYPNMKSAKAIEEAYQEAKDRGDGVIELAEEDHLKLKDAAENPKSVFVNQIMGPQTQMGYGYHPTLASQLLPMVTPIVEAKTERPKKTEVPKDGVSQAAPRVMA